MKIEKLVSKYAYWPEVKSPYQQNIDFSNTPIKDIIPLINEVNGQNQVEITDNIIRFYSLNETLSTIRQQQNDVLDIKSLALYQKYNEELKETSTKLFIYLFLISLGEVRHGYDLGGVDFSDEEARLESIEYLSHRGYKKQLKGSKLEEVFSFLSEGYEHNHNREYVIHKFLEILDTHQYSNLTVGDILKNISVIFSVNNFKVGYGGKPWANIASHANSFAKGDINAEVFIDQCFSLEHNSGNIFNKEIIFEEADTMYLYTYDQEQGTDRGITSLSNFLLTLQHNGLLTDFIQQDYLIGNLNKYYQKNKTNISSEEYDCMKNTFVIFKEIKSGFSKRNPEFLSFISDFRNEKKPINLFSTFNEAEEFGLGDDNKLYFQHLSQAIFNAPKLDIKDMPNSSVSLNYLDTKKISKDFMNKNLLGNKAYGLAQMHKMQLPVPDAWVFPSTNCAIFSQPKHKWEKKLKQSVADISLYLKDKDNNPVLCSVRSGSAVSMPGMMDTILNVGIDDTNYQYFCEKMGQNVVDDCAIKFMTLLSKSLFNKELKHSKDLNAISSQFKKLLKDNNISYSQSNQFALSSQAQYALCIETVFSSWNSERARAYREHHSISQDIGTAAIVQKMVFGNLNDKSCTGVVFSRDCINGKKGIIGEFLVKAQGEDVVSGAVTPTNIKEMKKVFPTAYKQLVNICETLEKDTKDIQDIEFTVEDNNLYILQKRKAVCSNIAQNKLNQELFDNGLITQKTMIASMTVEDIFSTNTLKNKDVDIYAKGLVANPGVMRGIVVHHEKDMKKYQSLYDKHKEDKDFGWIFYAPLTSPEHAPIMIKTQAFITGNGGFTSHAAILARSWKKPCVVGVGNDVKFKAGSLMSIDASNGCIYEGLLDINKPLNKYVKDNIKNLLDFHQVDLTALDTSLMDKQLIKINKEKSWMEDYKNTIIHKNTNKLDKFLSIGEKVALILLQEQKKSLKVKA